MLTVDNTLFVGKVLLVEQSICSTNDHAMSLLRSSSLPEGTVIYAVDQYGGRGQRGNTWQSEAGKNCTMSIVLQPKWAGNDTQFFFNKAMALAVSSTLQSWLPSAKLKWPNDIFVEDRKIAGILIENLFSGQRLKHSVVGIGVNVNQSSFGPGLKSATSMRNEMGKEIELQPFIQQLCQQVEWQYMRFQQGSFAAIQSDYLGNLYRLEEDHYYQTKEGRVLARIIDVNAQGQLVLQSNSGQRCYNFKEVIYT